MEALDEEPLISEGTLDDEPLSKTEEKKARAAFTLLYGDELRSQSAARGDKITKKKINVLITQRWTDMSAPERREHLE
jgi:hypothetical protein